MNTYMVDYRDYSKANKYKKYHVRSKTLRAKTAQLAVNKFRKTSENEIVSVLVPIGDLVLGFAQCWDMTKENWS